IAKPIADGDSCVRVLPPHHQDARVEEDQDVRQRGEGETPPRGNEDRGRDDRGEHFENPREALRRREAGPEEDGRPQGEQRRRQPRRRVPGGRAHPRHSAPRGSVREGPRALISWTTEAPLMARDPDDETTESDESVVPEIEFDQIADVAPSKPTDGLILAT